MPNITITNHFIKRYRERIAKTNRERIIKFASDAFINGKECKDVKNSRLRKKMLGNNDYYKSKSIMHKGTIYVFRGTTAITIYKVPKHIGNIKVYY